MADQREITITLSAKNLTHAEFTKARTELAGLSSDATRAGQSAAGMGGWFKTAGASLAGFVGGAAIMSGLKSGISAVGAAAIGMNADLEKSTLQFGTLMGDSKRAEAHVRDLFEFAKKTPFETGPIIQASRLLETFGGKALNSMGNLTLLGDAAAATGAPIEDLSFWIGRMYANLQQGKPVGEAIQNLTQLGVISPDTATKLEAVAASGKSVGEKFAVMQEGLQKFGGAMVAQAGTWEGLKSSISDAVNIMMADALKPLFDLMKTGAQIALVALGSEGLQGAFSSLKSSMSTSLGTGADGGAGLVKGFINGLLTGVDLGLAALGLFGQGWGAVKAAVYGAGAVVLQIVSNMLAGFGALVDGAARIPGIGEKFKGAAESIQSSRDLVDSLAVGFKDLTAEAWNAANGHDTFGKAIDGARAVVSTLQAEISRATIATNDHAGATRAAESATGGLVLQTKEQAKAAKEAARDQEKFLGSITGVSRAWEAFKPAAEDASAEIANIAAGLEESGDLVSRATADTGKLRAELTSWAQTNGAVLAPSIRAVSSALTESTSKGATFGETLKASMKDLPKTMQAAVQGGGDVGKSVGSSIGGSLGDWAGKMAGPALGNMFGKTVGGAVGTMFGPLGTMVGGFLGEKIGGVASKVFGKVFGGEGKKVNDMRDDFVAAAGGIQALDAKAHAAGLTLDRLLKAKNVKDYQAAIEELNGAFKQTEADTELAKQAMEEWGISATEAGQKFAQAEMDATANDMLAKLKAATAAGVDLSAIVTRGGDDFGKMVHQAIRTGTTISNEFRPVLAAMIENGTLIDENGDKFTDLGQIPFAEDLGSGIKELNLTMRELADFFMGGMKQAIGNATSAGVNFGDAVAKAVRAIPTKIEIAVEGRYTPPDIEGEGAGYAVGTKGRHGSWFVDFPSTGQAAQLHNREAVITEDQAPSFVADYLRSLGLGDATRRAGERVASAASAAVGALYVLVENKPDGSASARLIDENEAFRRRHNRLARSGMLALPARAVGAI